MRTRAPSPLAARRGHTLVELLAVLAILGIASMLAMPSAEPIKQSAVAAAATEVALALRFAQSDAIRTGNYRVVSIDAATGRLRVFGLDMTQTPPVEDTANPVFDPIDKKIYDLALSAGASTKGVAIASSVFRFSDGSITSQLGFAADGSPVNVAGPNPADVKALVGTGQVQLSYGAFRRTISVDAVTGRVTLSS